MIDARHLVDYASDAAFAVDGEQRVVAWNYGAQRLMGYTRSEVMAGIVRKFFKPSYPTVFPCVCPIAKAPGVSGLSGLSTRLRAAYAIKMVSGFL